MAEENEKFQVKKPALNGQTVIEPNYQQAIQDLHANINYFQNDIKIFDRPLTELRSEFQAEMCSLLGIATSDKYITTGHQPIFHHCGILAKYFLADKLAREINGKVYNFIIDTDIIEPTLALPVKSELGYSITNIPLLEDHGKQPAEFQPRPSSWELRRFRDIFNSEVILPRYENAAEKLVRAIETAATQSKTISQLVSIINLNYCKKLGLNRFDLPASKLGETAGFIEFTYNLLKNPELTWQCYNSAIDLFEKNQHPHKSPIPRLKGNGTTLEMPFWLVVPGKMRMPLNISLSDGSLSCGGEKEQILAISMPNSGKELQEQLKETALRIRPKAVTFTTFTRLYFADYFIHGIGGAYYDRVTDIFINNLFGIEPPKYSCVSATILPDFGTAISVEQAETQLNTAKGKLRDFESNPQRYVSFADNTVEVADLLKQKMLLVERSGQFRDSRAPRHEREIVFSEIKSINAMVCSLMPDIREKIEKEIVIAQKQLNNARASQYRELFFGLFEPELLSEIAKTLETQ